MIFVTLGTQDKEFRRLLQGVFDLNIEDEIFIQSGSTKFKIVDQLSENSSIPELLRSKSEKNYLIYSYIDKEVFEEYMQKASVIISHAGVGTIVQGLKLNKPMIIVPRREKYKEHVNDHQLEIVETFKNEKYIISVEDTADLEKAITEAKAFKPNKFISNNEKFNDELQKLIEEN